MSQRTRIPDDQVTAAIKHLNQADPVMRQVIDLVGPFSLRLETNRFRMLVRSIISQQISTKAARSIRQRLEQLFKPNRVTAESLARLSIEELRSVGLSGQKASYIHSLSELVVTKQVRLRSLGRMSDDDVIAELIQIKGIGVWTAQMFLIFCLGRLDVFPHDDLGIRSALRNLYELDELPDKRTSTSIAEDWKPYSSIASWYCWRSGDLATAFAKDYPV